MASLKYAFAACIFALFFPCRSLVAGAPVADLTLSAPLGQTTDTRPTFTWTKTQDYERFVISLCTEAQLEENVCNNLGTTNSFGQDDGTADSAPYPSEWQDLTPGQTYYWRLAGKNFDGSWDLSSTESFFLVTPGDFTVTLSAEPASSIPTGTPVTVTVHYDPSITLDEVFWTINGTDQPESGPSISRTWVEPGSYFIQTVVRGENNVQLPVEATGYITITVFTAPSGPLSPTDPVDIATTTRPGFAWTKTRDYERFVISVCTIEQLDAGNCNNLGTSNSFGVDDGTAGSTSYPATWADLFVNQTYYWRIAGLKQETQTWDVSATVAFTIEDGPVEPPQNSTLNNLVPNGSISVDPANLVLHWECLENGTSCTEASSQYSYQVQLWQADQGDPDPESNRTGGLVEYRNSPATLSGDPPTWSDGFTPSLVYRRCYMVADLEGRGPACWRHIQPQKNDPPDLSTFIEDAAYAAQYGLPYLVRMNPIQTNSSRAFPDWVEHLRPPRKGYEGLPYQGVADFMELEVQQAYEDLLVALNNALPSETRFDITYAGWGGEPRRGELRKFFEPWEVDSLQSFFEEVHIRVFGADRLVAQLDVGTQPLAHLWNRGVRAARQDGYMTASKQSLYNGIKADQTAGRFFTEGVIIFEQWGGTIDDWYSDPDIVPFMSVPDLLTEATDTYTSSYFGFMGAPVNVGGHAAENVALVSAMLDRMTAYAPTRIATWMQGDVPGEAAMIIDEQGWLPDSLDVHTVPKSTAIQHETTYRWRVRLWRQENGTPTLVQTSDIAEFTTGHPDPLQARLRVQNRFVSHGDTVYVTDAETIFLDGSASTGPIMTYRWEVSGLGDAQGPDTYTLAPLPPGTHQLTLSVEDEMGETDAVSVQLKVITPSDILITALSPDTTEPQAITGMVLDWTVESAQPDTMGPACVADHTLYTGQWAQVDTMLTAYNGIYVGYDFQYTGELRLEAGEHILFMPGFEARAAESRLDAHIFNCLQDIPETPGLTDFLYDIRLWDTTSGQSVLNVTGTTSIPNYPTYALSDSLLAHGRSYQWRVYARRPGPNHIVAVSPVASFQIDAGLPPELVGISNTIDGVSTSWDIDQPPPPPGSGMIPPVFIWQTSSVTGIEGYELEVFSLDPITDEPQPHPISLTSLTESERAAYLSNADLFENPPAASETEGYLIDAGLARGVTYYWHVRALYDGTVGPWSETWSFMTERPAIATYYYLKDHQGSIRVTVNESSQVVHYDDYYPFGLRMPGRSLDTEAPQERYTGHELDDETGFYYARSRYMDPSWGRWKVPDPLEQYASPYLYAGNNPLNRVDPDGQYAADCGTFEACTANGGDDPGGRQYLLHSDGRVTYAGIEGRDQFLIANPDGEKPWRMLNPDHENDLAVLAAYLLTNEGFRRSVSASKRAPRSVMSLAGRTHLTNGGRAFLDHPVTRATVLAMTLLVGGPGTGLVRGSARGGKALLASGGKQQRVLEMYSGLPGDVAGVFAPRVSTAHIFVNRAGVRFFAETGGTSVRYELYTTAYHEAFHKGFWPIANVANRIAGRDLYAAGGLWQRAEEFMAESYGIFRALLRIKYGIK